MAPPFVACRICYRVEGKLKNYRDGEFYVKSYEKLTGCPFEELPWMTKFCPYCATLMTKLFKFMKMCRASYYQLVDYLNTGRKVTQPYIHLMQGWRYSRHPIHLTSWSPKKANILDYVHSPKKYKTKQKIHEDFFVKHVTAPKDETAEVTKPYRSNVYRKDHDDIAFDFNDQENMDYIESAIEDVEGYIELHKYDAKSTEVSNDDTEVSNDDGNVPIEYSIETAVEEIKMEEYLEQHILEDDIEEHSEEQNGTELKLVTDPDNLTLQEIKEKLRAADAGIDVEDFTIEEVVEKRKGMKKKKKESKIPKQTQRHTLRAKRLKINQELEDHFTITSFISEEEQLQEFLKRRQSEGYLEGRYKCELCLKSFKEQKWMDTHVRKHEPSAGTYMCSICKIRCRTPKLFRTHRDANHTTKYSCKRCPYVTYSKAQALKHHGWHEGVEHTCQHCGATFRKHTTYMGHLRRAHPSSYICGACARSFVSAYGLNLHIKAVHKDVNKLEKDSTKCEECDVTFVSHKMYIRHILITDKHKEMSKDILGCRKCGEQFQNRELMEQHTHYKERKTRRTEVPKRSIKCDECDEVFSHPNGVYQHYLREHPDKPYRFAIQRHYLCEQCGKTFKSPGLLQQHALIHKGLRPPAAKKQQGRNSCRICGKTYSKLSGLFRHKLTHQGVRRHKCHICEKAFTDTSNLKQHVQGVHLNIRRVRKR